MDTQIDPVMEPASQRFIPASLANRFAPAHLHEAEQAVRGALVGYPGSLSPAAVTFFANGLRRFEVDTITATCEGLVGVRNARERLAHCLANFIQFLIIAFPPGRSPFSQEPACPPDVDAIYRWAASELHAYGRLQSFDLADAANRIVQWCRISGIKRVDIIESPLGATLPVRVLEKVLSDSGIQANSHQFLTPRLDKHGIKYSIQRAARDFCKNLPSGSHPVLFPDEVLTGTRFLKLYRALSKRLDNRLLPIAFQTRDAGNPHPPKAGVAERLKTALNKERTYFKGLPTRFKFTPALLFYIDDGNPFCASNPFFWTELDVCAGKRKISLVFGLLCAIRGILERLEDPEGEMIGYLCEMWGEASDGTIFSGHESILRERVPVLAKMVKWDEVEARARETFVTEYEGEAPRLDADGVTDRMEWVLGQIREQIDGGMPTNGATEGWLLRHAASDLFALSNGRNTWKMPRDRDFCEYTLPYLPPVSSIHDELVSRVVADAAHRTALAAAP